MIPEKLLIEILEEATNGLLDMDSYLDKKRATSTRRALKVEGIKTHAKYAIEAVKNDDEEMQTRLSNLYFTGQMIIRGIGFSNQPGEQMLVVISKQMENYRFRVFKPKSFLTKAKTPVEYMILSFHSLLGILESMD